MLVFCCEFRVHLSMVHPVMPYQSCASVAHYEHDPSLTPIPQYLCEENSRKIKLLQLDGIYAVQRTRRVA